MENRPRVRELGITIGSGTPGALNALTDVPGIRVGQTTLHEGERFHTGVTAIVPDALPAPAGLFAGNGYGKLVGATQVAELGEVETPVLLTGTLSAFRVADALVTWCLAQPGHEETLSLNPVVGETNDGELSDIRARPVTADMVFEAIEQAHDGPVAEGCVGAGSGTVAMSFKAGIGTASRMVELPAAGDEDADRYTLGVLVQANFGGLLTVQGHRVPAPPQPDPKGNSCMIVAATDAPLDSRQLGRVARRCVFAMGRVGANFSHSSGDYALVLSTAGSAAARLTAGRGDRAASGHVVDKRLDAFFREAQDATEEALLDSLTMATTTHGVKGHVREAVPLDALRAIAGAHEE